MKLYEVSNFIKKVINIFLVVVILLSSYIYIRPFVSQIFQTIEPEQAPEIPYKVDRIKFTIDPNLSYDVSQSRITYLGNPETQWANFATKRLPLYEYTFSSIEDIDYTPRAKQIALALGYDNLNQIDNAEISNKYKWVKNGIVFEIDKITKRMIQIPTESNFLAYKQYLSSGNFVSEESPKSFVNNFLGVSGRFRGNELNELDLEPNFLRFEGNNLIESNNINSELSYVKVFRKLSNFKVVSKRYEFPQIYFYVTSLRPEIQTNFPNYRLIHFKLNKTEYIPSYNNYEFDLLPLTVAVEDIKNKRFVISDIKFRGDSFGAIPNPQSIKIQNITFDTFELGYYDNFEETVQNLNLQPIYIFKGNVELDSGVRGRVTAYVPALDVKYFKN
jgi:hypothetical protein